MEIEAPVAATEPPPPPAVLVIEAPPEPAPVTFKNRDAVRTALHAAILATFLVGFLLFFAWVGAGFFAVLLYRRRTGRSLDIPSSLRLGGLTGLLAFAIPAALFAVWILLMHTTSGGMDTFHAMMQGVKDPQRQKAFQWFWEVIHDPVQLFAVYVQCFVLATFFCMAGGLLAGLVGRRTNPRPSGGNTV